MTMEEQQAYLANLERDLIGLKSRKSHASAR
jgi:hypothetical protein